MAGNSSSLGSLLTEDSLKKSRPSPGRQRGSRLDQGISGRKAKHKPVYASDQDGQLHKLSETKVKFSKRKSNQFDQTKASGEAKNQRQPPVTPNKKSTATATKPHREPAKYDWWDPDRICDICEARFYLTSQLARHLADPTTHLETPDLEKKAPTASISRPGNRPGIPSFSTRVAQPSSLPLPTESLRSTSQSPAVPDRWQSSKAQPSKKRSWEEYSEHENLSHPQSERFRKSEDAREWNIIDLTSPDKVISTNVLQQPVTDRPTGRTPSTPTKSQPYPAGKLSSNSPELDRIRSSLNFQLSPPRTQPKPITEPSLCPEQQRLVKVIMSGRNVFYTGSAGCGKSTVLKNFVERLKGQFVTRFDDQRKPNQYYKTVDIIAPTGRAALDINGSTFWTYAGWTPDSMKKPLEKLKDAAKGKWVRKRLKTTDVLVIDEISMVEAHHLERLNHVMQAARGNIRPFGGVQLVVTGDFCQLPPVKPFAYCYQCGKGLLQSQDETLFTCLDGHGQWEDSEKWAFCSSAWTAADFIHVNLTTVHRQSDSVFIDILQKCRLGVPFTAKEETLLLQHESQTGNAVKLFSTRAEVGAVNREAFNRLKTAQRTYASYDDFRCYNINLESKGRRNEDDGSLVALRDHRFDTRIDLKQGMVVVLLVNLDQSLGLVNGSQGVIMGFEKAEPGKMPEAIKKDSKGEYDFSRIGSSGLVLTGEHAEVREANIRTFMERSQAKEWPKVLFQNRIMRTIYADCRINELGDEVPYSLMSRTQIPLVAGWAMTVHKSQGMTLNRVVVDLSRSFEEGQMYVALSRATSLEGLKVEGLGKQQGCNERVRQFLRERLGIEAP